MEINKKCNEAENHINIIEPLKNFLDNSGISEMKELYSKSEKYSYFIYAFAKKIITFYMSSYNKKIHILHRRKLLFLIKSFINKNIRNKYKLSSEVNKISDILFLFIIEFSFIIYKNVITCKDSKEIKAKYQKLNLYNKLFSKFIFIVGSFYLSGIIKENQLEAFLQFLIILSLGMNSNEAPNSNDNIINVMFLVQSIKLIKKIFNKISKIQKTFTKEQETLMNNIIIFIKDKVIAYSDLKPINVINKYFLSNNDRFTTSLMDLIYIIVKMKDNQINNNFIELISNIYMFSFGYENMMLQMLKIIEPLLMNMNKKSIEEIDSELNIIHFIFDFINELIKREDILFKEEPLLREGFFLGNKICGISSELDNIEDDFVLIIGFCLYEKYNKANDIKEWTLINIRTKDNKDKDRTSQIKIWLSKIDKSDGQYNLKVSVKNEAFNTGIIINSKKTYIFAFNFFKNKKLKISYIDKSEENINKSNEITLQKFNVDNTNIYIGCDIYNKINLVKEANTFLGYIGSVIILNKKKLSKKGDEIIDFILKLKGDYASSILMSLGDTEYKVTLINNEEKYYCRNDMIYREVLNKIIECNENASSMKFVESIKAVISPHCFTLLQYKDEIDYLNLYNNYKAFEEAKGNSLEVRQNYLDIKQKTSFSKGEKIIKIFSPFFNSRFNIFKNKYSLEEFIKYDGIYFLCLILEYYYQIMCNIKNYSNQIGLFRKISECIIELIEFFLNKILNENYLLKFIDQINKFFYQMTITLKKYFEINSINSKIWDLIDRLIMKVTDLLKRDKINSNKAFSREKLLLKLEFMGLLHDILFLYYKYQESSYEIIDNYINIVTKLLNNQKLDDLYSNELIDEFLSLCSILDNQNKYNYNKEQLNSLQKKYEAFLIKLLDNTVLIIENSYKNQKNNESSSKDISDKQKRKKTIDEKSKEEKRENNNIYLNHFVEFTLQITDYPYIFSKLLNVLYKSNLVREIKPIYMEHILNILLKTYQSDNKKNKLTSESCLKILLIYYLSNKEEEKKFHNFLKGLSYYKGFFNSVIASIRYIAKIGDEKLKIKNEKSESTIENESNISDINSEIYPLLEIDLNKLNNWKKDMMIKLFQDCVSMLFNENTLEIDKNIEPKDAKEIYDTLKKNFDKIFEIPGKSLYNKLFSSESQITPELFYFKWKKSNEEDRQKLFNDIKIYHDQLLKNNDFPFIFKLILLIDFDEDKAKEEYIIQLLFYLKHYFEEYFKLHDKKIKKDEKENLYFINNLTNFVVVINKLFFKENSLYLYNDNFRDIFFGLIDLLQNTGLLYSNYCFEVNENAGKLISEICYDIILYILNCDEYFEKYNEKFAEIFCKENNSEMETYSIFYLIDLNKEEVLKKEKEMKKELSLYITNYHNLRIIQEYFFNKLVTGSKMKVFGKQIHKVEEVNLTIYFLAKTFIYAKELASINLKALILSFLKVLSGNLYTLYTRQNLFYRHKICNKFLLYKETKEFFESHAIQSGNDFEIYKNFFEKDIPIKLNGNDKIQYIYASRLLDKKEYDNINIKVEDDQSNKKIEETNIVLPLRNKSLINVSEKSLYFFSFDSLKRENIIISPKKFFMKIIFSSAFKDIFFKDETFIKIKKSFISIFRDNRGLNLRTKQLDYPSKEKNFSNFLEPKSFLRRDFRFYKNDFFPVSHLYIKPDLINDRDDDKLFFYRHDFHIVNEVKQNIFECELITNQFFYFGDFSIHKDYIYFKTKIESKDKSQKLRKNLYSKYIFSASDTNYETKKEKIILIFIKDIKEIIKRRTLLMKQSIEIFNKFGKSYFFNFFNIEQCENACKILTNLCKCSIEEGSKETIKKVVNLFKKGDISNYEYLLYLNKLATRSFNDLSQYPVFPWLVTDITRLISEDRNPYENNKETPGDENESNLRDMNYPISMQNPNKREEEIEKFIEDSNCTSFPYHLGTHYSTSSYIFYYLMRNNPYCQNLIKLQNYRQENPNRMFLTFKDTQKILKSSTDNRELIPDIYCYVDFFCNVNCAFFGMRANNDILVDDFSIDENYRIENNKYTNLISNFVEFLYVSKKLLNDINMSKGISQWVDIIFGKKQLPKEEERAESCNIFGKLTYEQRIDLREKLNKYIKAYEKDTKNEKKYISKLQNRINIIINFGVCPCQILTESYFYEGNTNINPQKKPKKDIILKSENYIYFTKSNGKYFDIFQNLKESPPVKRVNLWNNLESRENIYICGNFESEFPAIDNKGEFSKYLYKPNYVISLITLINHHNDPEIFILTCRYFGNYFKVQNSEKETKIICEDFVTAIASRNSKQNDSIFYTGLKNGKLVKWKLILISTEALNIKKKKSKSSIFDLKEKSYIYDHKSSITAIEINNKKKIIATAGEDNYIHIRKLCDFEMLIVINLTYCFGNPIISKSQNIFPSLIRISDLNCIYVLIYDFDKNINFIRGYTLNGLFFAQTEYNGRDDLFYNNIIINKNGNLIVGLYNQNKILQLKSNDLTVRKAMDIKKKGKADNLGTKWIEFDDSSNSFIIVFNDECQINFINEDKEKQIFNS